MDKRNPSFGMVLHLSDIYDLDDSTYENEQITRYENIQKRFYKHFGENPSHFVRVPGSTHIFSETNIKLSINLTKDIVIAYRESKEDKIQIISTQNVYYPPITMDVDPQQKIPEYPGQRRLENLAKAFLVGYKSVFLNMNDMAPKGFTMLIALDDLSNKMGVGWNSAISIGSAMVTLAVNKIKINKQKLIENMQKMKQQFCQEQLNHEYSQIFGYKNCLQKRQNHIVEDDDDDRQLEENYHSFLKDYHFLICDSLCPEPKMLQQTKRKAKKQAEISITLKLLRKKLNLHDQSDESVDNLQRLLGYSDEDMIQFIKSTIDEEPYSQKRIEQELEQKLEQIIHNIPYQDQLQGIQFNLFGPLTNYFREQIRARQTYLIVESSESEDKKANLIGQLMSMSYEESYKLLDLNSPHVQQLNTELQKYQPLGTKIMESSHGIALISLIRKQQAQETVQSLQDTFYSDSSRIMLVSDELSQYAFHTAPSMGAIYLDPQYEIWF